MPIFPTQCLKKIVPETLPPLEIVVVNAIFNARAHEQDAVFHDLVVREDAEEVNIAEAHGEADILRVEAAT